MLSGAVRGLFLRLRKGLFDLVGLRRLLCGQMYDRRLKAFFAVASCELVLVVPLCVL